MNPKTPAISGSLIPSPRMSARCGRQLHWVSRLLAVPVVAALLLFSAPLFAQQQDDPSPHSSAQLISEVTAVVPGEPFTVALWLIMDREWHSYWRNPGDAGTPTTIEWVLPEGFTAGEMQWPYPTRIEIAPLMDYGYYDEVFLLIELTPPSDLTVGSTVTLGGRADWLICTNICLPATESVSLDLPVAESADLDSNWSRDFEATRARLPAAIDSWGLAAWHAGDGYELVVTPPDDRQLGPEYPYFFPRDEGVVEPAGPQVVARDGDSYTFSFTESSYAAGPAERLRGVLLLPEGETWDDAGRHRALDVDVPVTEAMQEALIRPSNAAGSVTLAMALMFALVGGLLLNLMPCVFPVLSIKILGFVNQGGEDRFKTGAHGLAFGSGVVLSFWVLAALILLLRAGGARLGWGFQLQSPAFVAAMAILFFGLALNLMGVFEVGNVLTRLGGRVARPSGYGDSFSSGVLATLIATPCTAPFMGAALGFALTQPPLQTFLIFGALGAGMATPYVVMSMSPPLLRLLPMPGPWMETMKQLLAFPLFGTVIWLVWVFGRQTGVNGAAYLLVSLMLLGLAGWIMGRWRPLSISARARLISRTVALAVVVVAVGLVVRGSRGEATAAGGLTWQPFSQELVQQLRAEGQPVFIDFTAAWCLSCQVNEQVVLASNTVETAFEEYNVATLKADWTRFDPDITEALESFGRSGVPLYVLYPSDLGRSPMILPTILTKRGLLEALQDVTNSGLPTSVSNTSR